MAEDQIASLIQTTFSRRDIAEKNDIISNGRPKPELPNLTRIHRAKNKEFVGHFHSSQYDNTFWLTGSSELNILFCWPCLLFSGDHNTWYKTGFDNLNTLSISLTRHEKSLNHIKCFLQLNSFGKNYRIDHQLDQQRRINDMMHNEKVKKNREILTRLIDVVCSIAKRELPFRGHDEAKTSANKGNYLETLDLISHYDATLATHLNESTIFRGTSSAIQNDLIEAISSLLTDHIKQDLKNL